MRDGDVLPAEFMARRQDWNSGIALYFRQRTVGNDSMVADRISLVKHAPGTIAEPMMLIEIQQAQQLMDELWQCGLRPSEGTGSAGSLAATERHLKDMQTIAMGLLSKDFGK